MNLDILSFAAVLLILITGAALFFGVKAEKEFDSLFGEADRRRKERKDKSGFYDEGDDSF